jgi:NAD(P)H-dependent FMN reductase
MKVIGFAGSSSKNSINKKLVEYTLSLFENVNKEVLNLNDFEVPLFSVDREEDLGIPEKVKKFAGKIDDADLLIVSMAEHNGSYTAAFKSLYDWTSRIPNRKVFNNKKLILLSTSPGGRGGQSVMETALSRFPRDGAQILGNLIIPNFYDHFKNGELINNDLKSQLISLVSLAQ